ILKTGADGTVVLLKDVGTVELGAEDYSGRLRFNGRDAVGMGVFQLSNANALEVDRQVRAELLRLSKSFPPGLRYDVAFDPTIVVVENIERHMREREKRAREAASGAMAEVASAVIATSLVLIAVFVPVAFFPGTTGRMYKQFSLTIAFSIAISAWGALTLAPA